MPITKLKKELRIFGTSFIKEYTFSCGNTVPIFDVWNMTSLNQIIGHAKFNNREYGNVFYRGECTLHLSLEPSLLREVTRHTADERMHFLVQDVINDPLLSNEIKTIDGELEDKYNNRHRIEGLLQHYGIPTRFVDIVDNHWVALWMGLYHARKYHNIKEYIHYEKREIPYADLAAGNGYNQEDLYQYIILLALPYGRNN